MVFNPATSIRQGHSERVEVAIARSTDLDQELLASLQSTTSARLETIATSPFMGVDLRGTGFEITALRPAASNCFSRPRDGSSTYCPDAVAHGDCRSLSPCGSPTLTGPTRRSLFPFWSAACA